MTIQSSTSHNPPDYDLSLVTVVVPAKDEELSIRDIVDQCRLYASEVIVVDGHSKDKTREYAEASGARIVTDPGKGKGSAIRYVIPEIKTPLVVFIDADFSHDPHDIPKLLVPLLNNSADHVTGSRLTGGSSELHGGFDECFRLMGSSFITACINWRFNVKLSDSQNGFRALKTEVLAKLGLKENLTTIEQEMIMKTLRLGYRMGEVPAHEYRRRYGESHINLYKASVPYVWSLFRYLFF